MEPNDKHIKEQLATGPLARNGFDARLRQRIESRIEEEGRAVRRPWKSVWGFPATLASLAVILIGIWVVGGHGSSQPTSGSRLHSSAPSAKASDTAPAGDSQRYALLIGLRKDDSRKQGYTTAAYRTVLVAHDGGRLSKVADNNGLFVPHKQVFWQIQTVAANDGRQAIRAVQATNRKTGTQDRSVKIPNNLLSERVLFAGNQYLSVQTTLANRSGGVSDQRHVKSLDQINMQSDDPTLDPHIPLEELLPSPNPSHPVTEQWSVDRNPGQWVPVVYAAASGEGQQLPTDLPADVVNRDKLTMSWQQIQKIDPSATDAFTYGNLLGVVVGNQIRVYYMQPATEVHEALTFPLAAGETVVMIQWAEGHYVDKWIKDMQSLPHT